MTTTTKPVRRETLSSVRAVRKVRALTVELWPTYLRIRPKGTRAYYTVTYDQIYTIGAKKRRRGASALQTGIEEGKGGRAMSEYFDINPPALDEAPEEQEPTVKLCPRCHREPRLVRGKVICWYECCDLEGPSGQSEPEAAEEWAAYLENEVVERDADTAAREWMDEIRGEAY